MVDEKASFYYLVKNNKNAEDRGISCDSMKDIIQKHIKLRKVPFLSDVYVDKFTIENNSDVIYCTRVTFFVEKNDLVERNEFYYIPFIHEKDCKQYYILIKDMKLLLKDIEYHTLHVDNYHITFTVVETTINHNSIEDIIVNSFLIHKELQNEEVGKIIATIMYNMSIFVKNVTTSEKYRSFLESDYFDNYRLSMNDLLQQIASSNKLKYDVDYELKSERVHKILNTRYIPEFDRALRSEPTVKIKPENGKDEFYCETKPTLNELSYHEENLPGESWRDFFGGTHFYSNESKISRPIKDSIDDTYYPFLKEYLNSVHKNHIKKIKKKEKENKKPKHKKFSIISSSEYWPYSVEGFPELPQNSF